MSEKYRLYRSFILLILFLIKSLIVLWYRYLIRIGNFLVIDIGEHLLNFLRNLTPIILISSIYIIILRPDDSSTVFSVSLGILILFISIIAIMANIRIFALKSLSVIEEVDEYEKNKIKNGKSVGLCEILKFIWRKDGFSQIIIICSIVISSLFVILISGAHGAMNLLKSLGLI